MIQEPQHEDLIDALRTALKKDLPGERAHLSMASRMRRSELRVPPDRSKAIPSSVLILLYPRADRLFTTFILRQSYDGVHSGQVSFPGGRREEQDKSLIETALREAQEEVNINPQDVDVLGTLTELYIPPSNYLVLPVVGYAGIVPDFVAEKSEVAEIIESDIDFLVSGSPKETVVEVRGYRIEAPYYDVRGHVVWGATAMILSELSHVIKSIT